MNLDYKRRLELRLAVEKLAQDHQLIVEKVKITTSTYVAGPRLVVWFAFRQAQESDATTLVREIPAL